MHQCSQTRPSFLGLSLNVFLCLCERCSLKEINVSSIWVYKFDGTIQCEADVKEISLERMREELSKLIGGDNILSMKKGQRPVITLCGITTGKINCYEITSHGWYVLQHGIMGPCGFERMDHGPGESADKVNIGRLMGSLTAFAPKSVQELIGHPLRVYKTGEMIALDWRPDRCNIEIDELSVIVKVWFG